MIIEPIRFVLSSCVGRSKRARLFPTKTFMICVRSVPFMICISAENSAFCAGIEALPGTESCARARIAKRRPRIPRNSHLFFNCFSSSKETIYAQIFRLPAVGHIRRNDASVKVPRCQFQESCPEFRGRADGAFCLRLSASCEQAGYELDPGYTDIEFEVRAMPRTIVRGLSGEND